MRFKITYLALVLFILAISNCLATPFSEPIYQQCWQFDSNYYNPNLVASDKNFIIIPNLDGSIIAMDKNGKTVWKSQLNNEQIKYIKVIENKLFIISKSESKESNLRLLSLESGLTNWINKFYLENKSNKFITTFTKSNNEILVFVDSANFYKVEFLTGVYKNEKINLSENKNLVLSNDETIYFYQENKKNLFEYEFKNNFFNKLFDNYFNNPILIVNYGKDTIISDEFGNIYNLQKSFNKIIWKTKLGGQVSEILNAGNEMYVLANDNFIYKFSVSKGTRFWKRKFLGRIKGEIIDLDKQIIVVNINESLGEILDFNGRLISQIELAEDNIYIGKPIVLEDKILMLTKNGIIAYSKNGCKNKAG